MPTNNHFSLQEKVSVAPTLFNTKKSVAFLQLMHRAVDAKPGAVQEGSTSLAAMAILKKYPDLLFKKGKITDHFGRKIIASPYQLFLGAGDAWAIMQLDKEIIPLIQNGEALALAQFKQQFPNFPQSSNRISFYIMMDEDLLYDDRNKEQIALVDAQIKKIIETISADPCTNRQATLDATKEAVATLCQIVAPKEGEVIRSGLHFPLSIMNKICKVYDSNFDKWRNNQLSFYSCAVIGAVEAALSAVDGQCFKNGVRNFEIYNDPVIYQGPDRRDGLFCSEPKGIPHDLAPIDNKLGREMFVDPGSGDSCIFSSEPGALNTYNKAGCGGGMGDFVLFGFASAQLSRAIVQLWRIKAEIYGGHYNPMLQHASKVSKRP